MPITISPTPPLSQVGPGSVLIAQSSVVDPGPLPWTYLWEIIQQVTERQMYTFSQPVTGPVPGEHVLLYTGVRNPISISASQSLTDGEKVVVNVKLFNDSGFQVDTGQAVFTWNNSVQQHADMLAMLQKVQGTGGFTQEDRDKAEITQMAVSIPRPGLNSVDQIASGITGFFTNPPGWAMQELDFVDIAGDGDLTRPGFGRGVNAYGAQAAFLEVPPQLGVEVGRPLVYLDRICKLTTVLTGLSQLEFYDRSAELYFSDQRFMWGTPFPRRITYSVFPGCVVRLFWLHLAPNWWPFP
jgi:hypothetical protein